VTTASFAEFVNNSFNRSPANFGRSSPVAWARIIRLHWSSQCWMSSGIRLHHHRTSMSLFDYSQISIDISNTMTNNNLLCNFSYIQGRFAAIKSKFGYLSKLGYFGQYMLCARYGVWRLWNHQSCEYPWVVSIYWIYSISRKDFLCDKFQKFQNKNIDNIQCSRDLLVFPFFVSPLESHVKSLFRWGKKFLLIPNSSRGYETLHACSSNQSAYV
jgi:hypothetical protein